MKNAIFGGMLFGLLSCGSSQDHISDKQVYFFDCEKLELADNVLLISSEIENAPRKFILNFGVNKSVIIDSSLVFDNRLRDKAYVNGDSHDLLLRVENKLFAGHKSFKFYPKPPTGICADKDEAHHAIGHYGFDFFAKSHKGYHLDFDNMTLRSLNQDDQRVLISKSGYKEIKSRFTNEGFYIFFTIKRKEYEFRFDTGYPNALSMRVKEELPFLKDPHEVVEDDNTAKASAKYYYNNKGVSFAGIYYSSAILLSGAAQQKAGMGFIKGFNWIIDIDNKKIYFKKNTLGIDNENPFTQTYRSEIKAGKLIVVERNSRAKKYKVGDEIISVNHQPITLQNICEIQQLLERETDWENLHIEVREMSP